MKQILSRLGGIRIILFSLVVMSIAGCGNIDWLPEYKRLPTTPDQFSFPTKTGQPLSKKVTSDPITVKGLADGTSSPIKISGGTESKYSINGGAETSADGTVKNGDTVTVSHTSAAAIDSVTTSTLQIGNVTGTFTSRTVLVTLQAFSGRTIIGTLIQTRAQASAVDAISHTISLTDSRGTARFAIGTATTVGTFFTTSDTSVTSFLNNQYIYVQKEEASTTTLKIDGVDYPVVLPAP